MKHCHTCNTETPKTDFHKRTASRDGLAARCKRCQSAYDKSRANLPTRVKARKEYAKTERGIERSNAAKKAYIDRWPVKRAAHVLVGNALRDGKIKRETECSKCGSGYRVQAHHDDYQYPLSVRWLCDLCHKQWHSENGEGLNP